jgi:poly(A) polymerase
LAYRIGPARALDAMLVRHALLGQMMPKSVTGEIEKGAQAVFPVKAADLPELSGKALGDQLRQLEADWVASGFSLTKTDLLK